MSLCVQRFELNRPDFSNERDAKKCATEYRGCGGSAQQNKYDGSLPFSLLSSLSLSLFPSLWSPRNTQQFQTRECNSLSTKEQMSGKRNFLLKLNFKNCPSERKGIFATSSPLPSVLSTGRNIHSLCFWMLDEARGKQTFWYMVKKNVVKMLAVSFWMFAL